MRRNDADCASGSFFGGNRREAAAPGAASAGRAGVGSVSFAGRSAAPRRGRCGPALLRKALRCSCRAVACGDRGASFPTLATGLLFGDDGSAATVIVCQPDNPMPGCLPAAATASIAATASASIKDSNVSRRAPRVVRSSRQAAALPRSGCGLCRPSNGRLIPRSAPAAAERHGESVPNAGASPRPLRNAPASRKRHPDIGGHAWPPRPHAGFPPAVRSPGLPESPPANAAIGRLQGWLYNSTRAPKRHQRRVFSIPRRCCAPGRFSAPSLPELRNAFQHRRLDCQTSREASVVTERCVF